MIQKTIRLKDGTFVILSLNEKTNKFESSPTIESNFEKYILSETIIKNVCTEKMKKAIKEYWSGTPKFNKKKIEQMINEDVKKIQLVYNLALDKLISGIQ